MSEPSFDELFGECQRSAVHLEMRDVYMTSHPAYVAWRAGEKVDGAEAFQDWFDLARATAGRGVELRRVRVVSEPVSEYIRFEHAVTEELNIAAGEKVRWLPRRNAWDLMLPSNDLWVLDGERVRFGYFTGDGEYVGSEITLETAVVQACVASFEAAWKRATDHQDFRLV